MIQKLQSQISTLQQRIANSANMNVTISNALSAMNPQHKLKIGKPDTFSGKFGRTWQKSLENIFSADGSTNSDDAKIKYAVSFMTGNVLQWR